MSKNDDKFDRWDDGDDEGTYKPRTGRKSNKKVHRPSSETRKPVSKKSDDFEKRQDRKGGDEQGYSQKRDFDKKRSFNDKPSFERRDSFEKKEGFRGKNRSFDENKRFDRNERHDKREFGGKKDFGKKRFDRGDRDDRGDFSGKRNFGEKRYNREDDSFRGKNQDSSYGKRRHSGNKRFERREDDFQGKARSFDGNKRFNRDDKREFGGKKDFGKKRFDREEGEGFKGKKQYGQKSFGDKKRPYSKDDPTRSKLLKRQTKRKQANKAKESSSSNIPEYDFKKVNKFKKGYEHKPGNVADQEIRLNRYISNAGICSRREADDLIANGEIKVNGKVITELGTKVKRSDEVMYQGKVLSREKKVYVLLNKPKNYLTTMDDPQDRRTVMDLVGHACEERIYPVGRLDRNTTGLLLFTNDGELATALAHPSSNVKKIYRIELNKPISAHDFDQLAKGIELEDGFMKPDNIAVDEIDPRILGVEIHSGKNRIVRRMFEHFGYEVERLDRTSYAGLTKKDIPRGKWRFLKQSELIRLKHFEKFK